MINVIWAHTYTYMLALILSLQDSDSEVDDGLDDLEKHLREKALRSMRKAQLSPSQMS